MTPRQFEIEQESKEIKEEFDRILNDFYDSWDNRFQQDRKRKLEHTRQTKANTP